MGLRFTLYVLFRPLFGAFSSPELLSSMRMPEPRVPYLKEQKQRRASGNADVLGPLLIIIYKVQ